MQKKNQIAQMRARNNDLKPLTAISNFNKLTYDVPIYIYDKRIGEDQSGVEP